MLPILTGGAGVGGTLLVSGIMSWLKGRKQGGNTKPAMPDMAGNPILQHIVQGVVAQAHANGHAALDAVVAGICAKVFPPAAPVLVPVVNKIADELEKKIAGSQA